MMQQTAIVIHNAGARLRNRSSISVVRSASKGRICSTYVALMVSGLGYISRNHPYTARVQQITRKDSVRTAASSSLGFPAERPVDADRRYCQATRPPNPSPATSSAEGSSEIRFTRPRYGATSYRLVTSQVGAGCVDSAL